MPPVSFMNGLCRPAAVPRRRSSALLVLVVVLPYLRSDAASSCLSSCSDTTGAVCRFTLRAVAWSIVAIVRRVEVGSTVREATWSEICLPPDARADRIVRRGTHERELASGGWKISKYSQRLQRGRELSCVTVSFII